LEYYKRKSPRIPDFDYSGDQFYFITICTHNKQCIFGEPEKLNTFGKMVCKDLLDIPTHFEHIRIDHYVVMPNHLHAIVVIGCDGRLGERPNLNTVVGQLKSGISRKIHSINPNLKVWQRSYHDHVIRNDKSYQIIWEYIETNPIRWEDDCFYKKNCRGGSRPSPTMGGFIFVFIHRQ